MKISEMTNDQATNAMVQIATPFENICNDDELLDALERLSKMKGEPIIKVFGKMIPIFAKVGLERHKKDLYEIVSALTMTPVAKVGLMNFKETLTALQDSYDEVIHSFFTSSVIARKIGAKK